MAVAVLPDGRVLTTGRTTDVFSGDGQHLRRMNPDSVGVDMAYPLLASSPSGEWITTPTVDEGPQPAYTLRLLDSNVDVIGEVLDRSGRVVARGSRNIPQPQRSDEEMSRLGNEIARVRGPGAPEVSRSHPHFNGASFRFDSSGRLWVRTFRGDLDRTIFDVFSPELTFLGEVIVPEQISTYDIGGDILAAAVSGPFDVRQVKLWKIGRSSVADRAR